MKEQEDLIKLIKAKCNEHSLYITHKSVGHFGIFTGEVFGITLFLKFENPTNFTFHFLQRTHDIVYRGDRSDAHVVISLMFASFLRKFDSRISCALFDIAHPVVNDEIWGRYIMPVQTPEFLGISTWRHVKESIAKLIEILVLWRAIFSSFISCPCDNCRKKSDPLKEIEYETPNEILISLSKLYKSQTWRNYNNRQYPDWKYYYDIKHEVTIIKSAELSNYLETIDKMANGKFEIVKGIHGRLIVDSGINNFVSKNSDKQLNTLFSTLLNNYKPSDLRVFPMENMIVATASPYIVALGRLSGINEFRHEKEFIRHRHNIESNILFPISIFEWEEEVCPDQFEALVKALLEREPNVKTVRRPAPVNQGDKGRDLLIEWYILNENIVSQAHPPTMLIKVVGQCKASQDTVGKSKVQDIRDTIESHNSSGFFLAVSSQISAPLTEKLEELQAKGIWTAWWNRDDIETRLSKNEDLIPLFPEVVKTKQQVKFVEK